MKFESIFMRQKVKRQLILVLEFNKSFWIIYFVTFVSYVRPSFRGEQDRVLIGQPAGLVCLGLSGFSGCRTYSAKTGKDLGNLKQVY